MVISDLIATCGYVSTNVACKLGIGMAYGVELLGQLGEQLKKIRPGGAILELGAQDVNADVPGEALLRILALIHGSLEKGERAARCLPKQRPIRAAELFRGSEYRYHSIDLFDGEFIINADLNQWRVPDQDRCSYDLITNQGTTEHIADQVNCFRVVHDYASVGGTIIHNVPFCGYFNHGLFNYHPIFFIFLAQANGYDIRSIELSPPHFPYTIPQSKGIDAAAWAGRIAESGMISCELQKLEDKPFQLFTDFDQETLGRMKLPSPWDEIVRDRYDLRIRD